MKLLRPRLRTVLLIVSLLILLLPLAGVYAFRIYENELIRSTEAQLLVQGVLVREAFRLEYLRKEAVVRGETGEGPVAAGPDRALPEPVTPRLDVARDEILPAAPPAADPSSLPDPVAFAAGEAINPVLLAAGQVTLAGIRVVDTGGVVVATTRSEMGLSLADREEVARALAGEEVSLLRKRMTDPSAPPLQSVSRGQRYRVFVALPVVEDGRVLGAVILSRTPLDIVKALYLHRRALGFGAAAILAVVVLVSTLTSLTISRPVNALIRQAERITRGESSGPIHVLGTYETDHLSRALDHMATTLDRRADYIRTFATHVSHEFKTPLTTIRGTVELLADHIDEMSKEERRRFLENLTESSNRLERLVRRMLELARADVLKPGNQRGDVAQAIDRAARRARESGLLVEVDLGPDLGAVRMSDETLEDVLGNLLDNARQHGGPGVSCLVNARLDDGQGRPEIVLTVSDDGPGISAANSERVFTPFFTTARDEGGSGLGLSIVRSLLVANEGTIELERSSGGTIFVIRLPVR